MSDLQSAFARAAQEAQSLSKKPSNETLLSLYALYKQATSGDAGGKRPGGFDFVGRAKYDAWAELQGVSQEDAMQRYIDLVQRLQQGG